MVTASRCLVSVVTDQLIPDVFCQGHWSDTAGIIVIFQIINMN